MNQQVSKSTGKTISSTMEKQQRTPLPAEPHIYPSHLSNKVRHFFLIITMGFFTSLFGCNKPSEDSGNRQSPVEDSIFVSEGDYQENRTKQVSMAPLTMKQLRGYGVTDESNLKLEYFFYTNTKQKAESLANELADRGYEGSHDVSAGDSTQFVITGWTVPMFMSDEAVVGWTKEMCDLSYKFDCEFDGWGTNPSQ